MDLTNDDVLRILKIIDESDYNDIRLEIGELKLHVRKQGAEDPAAPAPFAAANPAPVPSARPPQLPPATPAPVPQPAPAVAGGPVDQAVPEGIVAVSAPILGTFYRASAPGEKPFVEVGQKVGPNDTVCLIEVMKLFNSVKAGTGGTVVGILAENGKMVEHGQVLVLIKPDA